MKTLASHPLFRPRNRRNRVARMTRQALMALLVGHCAFTFTAANAAVIHVPTGDTWGETNLSSGDILRVDGTILSNSDDPGYWAVGVDPDAVDVIISNRGSIRAEGMFKAGIDIAANTGTTVRNREGAEIFGADWGISVSSALDFKVRNAGTIFGEWDAGISVSNTENVTIINTGNIGTDYGDGIESVNNVSLVLRNREGGTIQGDTTGIYASGESVTISNKGTIEGFSGSAIYVEAYSAPSGGQAEFLNRNGGEVYGDVFIGAGSSASATLNLSSLIDGNLTLESDTKVRLTVGGSGLAALSDLVTGTLTINSPEGLFHKRGDGILLVDTALDTTHFMVSNGAAIVTDMAGINGQHVYLTKSGDESALVLTDAAHLASFEWNGGTLGTNLTSAAPLITIDNAFLLAAAENLWILSIDPADIVEQYTLLTYGTGVYDLENLEIGFTNAPTGLEFGYELETVGNSIVLTLLVDASGDLLQNSAPVGTPTFAVFNVTGDAQTGGPSEDNTIRGLNFDDGGNLLVHNTLTVTGGEVTVDSGSGTIDGDRLVTPFFLQKLGGGELILGEDLLVQIGSDLTVSEGRLTVNGEVEAVVGSNEGELIVNGSLITTGGIANIGAMVVNGTVETQGVANAGLLGGSGTIFGGVYNTGILNPGNSPGTLTVVGAFAQGPAGSLVIEVGSESNHDRLWVTGDAYLDGTLLIGGDVAFGDEIRFLRAGSISGEFASIITNDGFRVRLLEEDDSLTALFAPEKYSDIASGDNHRSVAKALDRFIDATDGDRETVSLALDHLRADEYANAFQQISPAFHETIGMQAINLTQQQGRLLQQRIGTARYGLRGFRSGTVETTLQTDRDGKSVHSAKDVKEVVTTTTTEEANRWSVWLEGNGVFSRVTQAQQVPNGRTRAGGFVIGTDYAWNPNFITGLFAGYEGLETKYTDESRVTMNGSRFGGYATYQLDSGLYLDGLVWGGVSEYRSHRNIRFGSVDRTARATQNAGEVSALLGTGYDWKPGNWIMGPTASLQYTYLGIDGFTEDGAKSLNLDMDRQEIHSLRSNLGARIAYRYEVNPDVVIVPELRASWEYEFANDVRTMTGQLSGKDISYRTSSQERASLFAGAGVNALFNQRVSASLSYNVDVGRSDDTAHIISASFGVQW